MNQCVCTHSSDHLGLTQEAVEDWGRACEEENEVKLFSSKVVDKGIGRQALDYNGTKKREQLD